ncbi:minor tail protein [Gordonia phage ViaConlectus]|uniref:Minor tail protein n=1 Tax=Gordonia phage ViaConlectus TaxID=2972515 RepID=A0A976YGY4_9CAUD|nr:minor tail protein [Gordonia phage ViaConlectus]
MSGPGIITLRRRRPQVLAAPRSEPFNVWVVRGRDGRGIDIADTVDTYADLPTNLGPEDKGAGYMVRADKMFYRWSGTEFPDEGDGIQIMGPDGPPGRGIATDGIEVVGNQLRFTMTNGTVETVSVPAIQQAIDSAAAASASATAANTAKGAAEAAALTAGNSATTAVGARDAAITARTGAEGARDTAVGAATAADNSADAAALSESNADTSETNAAASAAAAAGSANTADTRATAAETARTGAQTARTGAETARDDAAGSATAAQTAADDAQDSATAAAASAAEAADVVTSGIPNATDTVKGGIRLAGDLGGTWDMPTVPALATKADLDPETGMIPTSQIPPRAMVTSKLVASTAERLALTSAQVQEGDIAVQSGNPGRGTYMLGDGPPSDPASWQLQFSPTDAVSSVNGYNGIVVLGKGDVGLGNADNTADLDKPISNAVAAALDGKVDEVATANVAYGTKTGGVQGTWPVTSAATATTLALRGTGGTVAVGDATAAGHAASKGQLDTGLSGKAAAVHQHSAADINAGTLDVARLPVGTSGTTVAAGNDSRIVNAVPNTRTVSAGTGLSGGGDLTANRTLAVAYGNTAGTAAQGNDTRLSDTRTPTDNTVATAKIVDAAVTVPKLGADVGPAIQAMIDTSVLAAQRVTVNAQAGAYTLVATDANKAVEVSSASAVNLTIPTDAAVAFPVGTVIEVDQLGAGKVTIVGASGVTVQAPVTPTTRAQYSALLLRKRAANLWLVSGDM